MTTQLKTMINKNDIDFAKGDGLVPAIVQDPNTLRVLMLGYMNAEAFEKTIESGLVTFYSRSRRTLWTKGETSGNYLHLTDIKIDCDKDTLLVKAVPDGPVCHTGTDTCWGETNEALVVTPSKEEEPNPLLFLTELQDFVEKRYQERPTGSYTTELFESGVNRMAQKVGEEALEAVIEATNGTNERLVYEGSDLLYHLTVLLTSKGLRIEDLARELVVRHDPNWRKH
jgi:phosphoribosyl-ATP pyrophosphohydrolase/phosphoribosyl-AMP cyclohydrolase